MKLSFALIAAFIAVLGNLPYLRDILRKKVVPHTYSWAAWSVVSAITFFGQIAKGAGVGAISTGASEIFTIIIFVFSIFYGYKKIKLSDKLFLGAALIGVLPWVITKDPTISVVIAVAIDLIAFVPTLRKTWVEPNTEKPTLYFSNVVRHILGIAALQNYNIATTLHSVAMICVNSVMVGLIKLHNKKSKK